MEPKLTDEPTKSRFELHDGDELVGWLDYRPTGESVILAHVQRNPELTKHVAPSFRAQFA